MHPDPRDEGRRWLEQSLQDLDDARYNARGERHNIACFLAQQAAEKALKGFLLLKGEEDVRGHSVGDLCERAVHHDRGFESLLGDARALDLFYIPTRYPNGLPGGLPFNAFDQDASQTALERAPRIVAAVERAFAL